MWWAVAFVFGAIGWSMGDAVGNPKEGNFILLCLAGVIYGFGGIAILCEYNYSAVYRLSMLWGVVQFSIGALAPYFLAVNVVGARDRSFIPVVPASSVAIGMVMILMVIWTLIVTADVVVHKQVMFEQMMGLVFALVAGAGLVYLFAFGGETMGVYAHGYFALAAVSLMLAVYEAPRFIGLVPKLPAMLATVRDAVQDPAKTIAITKH